jgi:hypothetical protein
MRNKPKLNIFWLLGGLAVLALLAAAAYQLPPVQRRLGWRVDFALTYVRGILNPIGELPTALPPPAVRVTSQPSPTSAARPPVIPEPARPGPTPTPTPSPTPLPDSVSLPAPAWERQDINNCGPTTLAMYLRFYGWEGTQADISDLIKPKREDRNVNVEELAYYVNTRVGWLRIIYRVGGDLDTLKKLLAAGIPVTIEESFYMEEPFWPNDDLWAAHYLLLTGYDDQQQAFTGQDSYYGADQKEPYQKLDDYWHSFNHVYIIVYQPEQEGIVQAILGEDWDEAVNRQKALDRSLAEVSAHPKDAFALFNLGSNLVYFERYPEAASAYDQARQAGLPQRMLRYQFGPFFAYFHTGRMQDLLAMTEYALKITRNSEEAHLWHGWALFRQGNTQGAMDDFNAALEAHPGYPDAEYALDFVRSAK